MRTVAVYQLWVQTRVALDAPDEDGEIRYEYPNALVSVSESLLEIQNERAGPWKGEMLDDGEIRWRHAYPSDNEPNLPGIPHYYSIRQVDLLTEAPSEIVYFALAVLRGESDAVDAVKDILKL